MSNSVAQNVVGKAAQVVTVVWRRRWLGLVSAMLVAAASALAVSLVHDWYKASARIYVDTQTVLKPLMVGLAYQPDIDQQLSMIVRTLISRPNVERLLETPEVKANMDAGTSHEEMVNRLMERIKIVPAGGGNLYDVSYVDSNSQRALRLVESTVALFVKTGAVAKKHDSEDAGRFISEQIRIYEAKLTAAEDRLKEFKLRNFGVSGVSSQDHFARISALSDEVAKLRLELAAAEHGRDAFRRELSNEDPQLPAESQAGRPSTPVIADLINRLETQRKQLDELLRRFTEQHPDVVSARRIIDQLESELARQRKEEAARSHADKPGRAATSPVYQKIRVSLAEAEAHVAALRAQLATQQAQLSAARAMAGRIPEVEAEYAQLNRDYDIIHKNYQGLVARRESASLGIKLDESSRLAEFRVVEPPLVSPSPVFPSRAHLALIAAAVAFVIGIALPLVLDYFVWPTFKEAAELQKATGRPVLGSIALTAASRTGSTSRTQVVGVAASFALLLAAQAIWVLWLSGRMNIG